MSKQHQQHGICTCRYNQQLKSRQKGALLHNPLPPKTKISPLRANETCPYLEAGGLFGFVFIHVITPIVGYIICVTRRIMPVFMIVFEDIFRASVPVDFMKQFPKQNIQSAIILLLLNTIR